MTLCVRFQNVMFATMNSDAHLGGLKRQMVVGAALAVVGPLAGVMGITFGVRDVFARLEAEVKTRAKDPATASAAVGNVVIPGLCCILGGAAGLALSLSARKKIKAYTSLSKTDAAP